MKRRANKLARLARRKERKANKKSAKVEYLKSLNPVEYEDYMKKTKDGSCNVHHRHTRWLGGSNHKSNLSVVPIKEHDAFNQMFDDGHMHPTEIARKLTEVWINPEWEIIARQKGGSECTDFQQESLSVVDSVKRSTVSEIGFQPPSNSSTQLPQVKSMKSLALVLIATAQQLLEEAC